MQQCSINDRNPQNIFVSCASLPLSFPSDYYWVTASNGSAVRVYCDMTRSCGGVTGGWMRVAYLNMTDSSQQCPSDFKQHNGTLNDSTIFTCVRSDSTSGGCSSIFWQTENISYVSVCGRVQGYQIGTTNAFGPPFNGERDNFTIDEAYVDGVSLTYGSPREHIVTLASGLDEAGTFNSEATCPCSMHGGTDPPAFVNNDYLCDTGARNYSVGDTSVFFPEPLWDDDGVCVGSSMCFSLLFSEPPWFFKLLPQATSDNIEMRVCRDEGADNEDIAIEIVEIYVR